MLWGRPPPAATVKLVAKHREILRENLPGAKDSLSLKKGFFHFTNIQDFLLCKRFHIFGRTYKYISKQMRAEKDEILIPTFKGDKDSGRSNYFVADDLVPRSQAGQRQDDEHGPHIIQPHGGQTSNSSFSLSF